MKVSNWDKWQSFRKDRGTPPWIKLYRNLLSNEQWVTLSDEEKGQLVSIWMLAADKDGVIPDNAKMIQRMAMLDAPPNLNKFIELGFLTSTCQPDDNQVVTIPPQLDAPEKRRVETEKSIKTPSSSSSEEDQPIKKANIPYQKIADLYNSVLGEELPKVQSVTEKRKRAIKKLWNMSDNWKTLETWENYFQIVRLDDHTMGRTQRAPQYQNWKADLEYVTNQDRAIKFIEAYNHANG